MAEDSRKPLVVLAVLLVLAIVLFVTGAVGASRSAPSPEWSNPFGTSAVASPLRPGELEVADGSCSVGEAAITLVGGCVLRVLPVEGGWPWERVTRSVRLIGVTGPVKVTLTVQGKQLGTDLDPGDDLRATFTRDGGDLVLGCLAVGGCTVTLAQDGPR